jgi:hypothetical protein
LVEDKEAVGVMEQIEDIGKQEEDDSNIGEY